MEWQSLAMAIAAPSISVLGVLGAAWFAFRGKSVELKNASASAQSTAHVNNLIDERARLYARIESLESRAIKDDERYETLFGKYNESQTELATLRATMQMMQREMEQYKAVQIENQQLKQDNKALRDELTLLSKENKYLSTELSSARALINTLQAENKQPKMAVE